MGGFYGVRISEAVGKTRMMFTCSGPMTTTSSYKDELLLSEIGGMETRPSPSCGARISCGNQSFEQEGVKSR